MLPVTISASLECSFCVSTADVSVGATDTWVWVLSSVQENRCRKIIAQLTYSEIFSQEQKWTWEPLRGKQMIKVYVRIFILLFHRSK